MRHGKLINGILITSIVVAGCAQVQSTPPAQQPTTQVVQTSTSAPAPNPELDKQLVKAVEAIDSATVESLLKQGANPNTKDSSGEPLLLTTAFGSSDRNNFAFNKIAKILLEHKANPNATSSQGDSVLYWAVLNGNIELVRLLLDAGADPNGKYRDGSTALQVAEPFPDIVTLLHSAKGKTTPSDNNATDIENLPSITLELKGVDSSLEEIFRKNFSIVEKGHNNLIYRKSEIVQKLKEAFPQDRPDLANAKLTYDAASNEAYFTFQYSPNPQDLDTNYNKHFMDVKIASYYFIEEPLISYFRQCQQELSQKGIQMKIPRRYVVFSANDNQYLLLNRVADFRIKLVVKLADKQHPTSIFANLATGTLKVTVEKPQRQDTGKNSPEADLIAFFNAK